MREDAKRNREEADPAGMRRRLEFTDAKLVAECEVQLYKASGPGGQHRNKVTSAVRLIHKPSGLVANAVEARSQHENKSRAIWRMREALALSVRVPWVGPVRWPDNVQPRGRLRVNEGNPSIHIVVATVLDALAHEAGDIKRAAAHLGQTTSGIVKFLSEHRKAWRAAQSIRADNNLAPLHAPR